MPHSYGHAPQLQRCRHAAAIQQGNLVWRVALMAMGQDSGVGFDWLMNDTKAGRVLINTRDGLRAVCSKGLLFLAHLHHGLGKFLGRNPRPRADPCSLMVLCRASPPPHTHTHTQDPSSRLINTYQTLCRNGTITNMRRYGENRSRTF